MPESLVTQDPAWHGDLQPLSEVELQFLGTSDDSFWPFLCFRLPKTMERIDVAAADFLSLDRYAKSLDHDLQPGDRVKVVIVSQEKGRKSISIRPYLRTSIEDAHQSEGVSRGKVVPTHSAVIVSEPNAFGSLDVALDGKWAPCGVTVRVQAKVKNLERKSLPTAPGQHLEVSLASTFDEASALGPLSEGLEALVKQNASLLAVKGKGVHALGPINQALARKLLALHADENWHVKVSGFLQASQTLCVTDVFPAMHRLSVTGSKLAVALISNCRQIFDARYVVKAEIGGAELVLVSGKDGNAVALAAGHLTSLDNMRYIAARLPQGTAGRIVGTGGEKIRALRERPGLDWAWIAEDVISLLGQDRRVVDEAFALVRSTVAREVGMVSVPTHQIAKFIGKQGDNLRAAREGSKCAVFRTAIDGQWKVEAPSKTAMDLFVALARNNASDLIFRHQTSFRVETLVDHDPLRKAISRARKAKVEPPPQSLPPQASPTIKPAGVEHRSPTNPSAQVQPVSGEKSLWSMIRSRFLGS